MELTETIQPAITRKQGSAEHHLKAGEHIMIKMHNETILNINVPQEKAWHVTIEMRIEESNL